MKRRLSVKEMSFGTNPSIDSELDMAWPVCLLSQVNPRCSWHAAKPLNTSIAATRQKDQAILLATV